jgi:PIN domain nuclease of toxin-antitoxin system
MKILLDTHVFLWWLSSSDQLAVQAVEAIGDPTNQVYVSVITL